MKRSSPRSSTVQHVEVRGDIIDSLISRVIRTASRTGCCDSIIKGIHSDMKSMIRAWRPGSPCADPPGRRDPRPRPASWSAPSPAVAIVGSGTWTAVSRVVRQHDDQRDRSACRDWIDVERETDLRIIVPEEQQRLSADGPDVRRGNAVVVGTMDSGAPSGSPGTAKH